MAAGEELLVTYVDPSLGVRQRRMQLGAWGFGECGCERCIEEAKELGETSKPSSDVDDLERELKAGLGVM